VLGIILGGGAGSRLYPLTKTRAKPAVPLGANYRLIDIPVSNCINSGVNKIYCMTQFNSASLNRHLASAYVRRSPPLTAEHCVLLLCLAASWRVATLEFSRFDPGRVPVAAVVLIFAERRHCCQSNAERCDPKYAFALQNANVGSYSNEGFVEVLAATQSPISTKWFQVRHKIAI